MQKEPLLEQLDWFFTSVNWTLDFPSTEALPMAKITSDHIPCKIAINTKIPRSSIFRFENFWAEHDTFLETVHGCWESCPSLPVATRTISSKFKKLRSELKSWSRNLCNLKLLISNCNTAIGFLDSLEDSRPLYNKEANLRLLVKGQLKTLLHYKKLYWRKRYTVNRIKLGDECTKIFHSMATISFRRNSISQIFNDQGVWIQDHAVKAGLLWNSFRNRMGVTSNPNMLFDLANLIIPSEELQHLEAPFQQDEIDQVVKKMPSDKAPGPDSFNGLFMKKCWNIIRGDFYDLCKDFSLGTANLQCINKSYITLVPKTNNPETVSDYRPVSLMNINFKLITKILVDRLQSVITRLIHRNQYDFIVS
jgi:hypothetical protein